VKIVINVFTLLGSVLAIAACLLLLEGNQPLAFVLVIVAMAVDMTDGALARRAGVESRLGRWLDSFGDLFIYLLFPAIYWRLAYDIALPMLVLFVGTGCFRLVRFTLIGFREQRGKLFYGGMPVYYDQLVLALTLAIRLDQVVLSILLVAMSVLAVSTIPFFKLPVRVLSLGLVVYIGIIVFKMLIVY
jgi:phosphatidylserine synthase